MRPIEAEGVGAVVAALAFDYERASEDLGG